MTTEPAVIDEAPPPAATDHHRGGTFALPLLIAAGVVLLDQVTKHWAQNYLTREGPQHLFWTLQLNLTFNSGMAFSKGRGIGPYIGVVAIIVIVFLAVSARRAASDSKLAAVAAGLVIGGAIGNLIDRLFRGDGWLHGAVIDFVDFQWFPIFNVADAAITIGGVLFVVWTLRRS